MKDKLYGVGGSARQKIINESIASLDAKSDLIEAQILSIDPTPAKSYGTITLYDQRDGESSSAYINRSMLSNDYNSVWISTSLDALNKDAYLPNIVEKEVGYELIVFNNSGEESINIRLYPASYNQFESPADLPNNGTNSHNNKVTILPQGMCRFVKGIRGLGWSVFMVDQLNSANSKNVKVYNAIITTGENPDVKVLVDEIGITDVVTVNSESVKAQAITSSAKFTTDKTFITVTQMDSSGALIGFLPSISTASLILINNRTLMVDDVTHDATFESSLISGINLFVEIKVYS